MKLNTTLLSHIPESIALAKDNVEKMKIREFRDLVFSTYYGKPFPENDCVFDLHAIYLCSRDRQPDSYVASARIVLDSSDGLPCEIHCTELLNQFRSKGSIIAEMGNLAITQSNLLPKYLVTYFEIARQLGVSDYFFTTKNPNFYRRCLGADVLIEDIGYQYGSNYTFSLIHWDLLNGSNALSQYAKQEIYDV